MTTLATTRAFNMPSRSRGGAASPCKDRIAWISALTSLSVLMAASLMLGSLPLSIGADTDDAMRFLQIRDLLEGQDWRDVTQSRLGVDGTPLHWSRLADLPYLIVAWPLSFMVGADSAVRIAGSIVPFALWGAMVWALVASLRTVLATLDARYAVSSAIVAVVAMHALMFSRRFGFGSFDHHHIQALCLAVALAGTLAARPGARMAAATGAALAASALVGLEALPLIVLICGIWALHWGIDPHGRATATRAFGVALVAMSLVGGAVFAVDYPLGSALCDAFGFGIGGGLVIGGTGLAGLASLRLFRGEVAGLNGAVARGMPWAGLIGLGMIAALFAVVASPQCLANPMDALSMDVRTHWLDRVTEAQPAFGAGVGMDMRGTLLGVPAVALLACLYGFIRLPRSRRAAAILAACLAVALGLALYQVRFGALALVPATLVMGAILVVVMEWETAPVRRTTAMLATALLSMPMTYNLAFAAFEASPEETRSETPEAGATALDSEVACTNATVLEAIGKLEPGRFATPFNVADDILVQTHHSLLASNYHRGWRDIARQLEIERSSSRTLANTLRGAGVDYLLVCRNADGQPDGVLVPKGEIFTQLKTEESVPGLARHDLGVSETLSRQVELWRVLPE